MFEIISRAQWGTRFPTIYGRNRRYPGPWTDVYAHTGAHPGGYQGLTWEQDCARIRADERYHVENLGWNGLGYSFVVSPAGRAFEGRGWLAHGAHTEGHNHLGHGIQFMGHGDLHEATPAQLATFGELVREGIRLGVITRDPWLGPHAMYSLKGKSCPGVLIQRQLGISKTTRLRFYSVPALAATSPPDAPTPAPLEDDDMSTILLAHTPGDGKVFAIFPSTRERIHLSPDDVAIYRRLIGKGVVDAGDVSFRWAGQFNLVVWGASPYFHDRAYESLVRLGEEMDQTQVLLQPANEPAPGPATAGT